jgi:phenylalanyl-tRNA synthetase alpha chain
LIQLRENEAAVLKALKSAAGNCSFDELVTGSGQESAAVTRGLTSLVDKQLVNVRETEQITLRLTDEGALYAKHGLPERRIIQAVLDLGGEATLEQASRRANIQPQMASIALGWIKVAKWCEVASHLQKIVLRVAGVPDKTDAERLLDLLAAKPEVSLNDIPRDLRNEVEILRRRRLVESRKHTRRYVELSSQGWKALEEGIDVPAEVSDLTPEFLVSGQWRNVTFRRYNISAPVAPSWPGKKQPYREFLDELKKKLVNLGFMEMVGPTVELMFFNCDALFMPQDHPAREIHDLYFIKTEQRGELGENAAYLDSVAKTHENGWKTGSTGWGYSYSRDEAFKLVLRSQGTDESARTLVNKNLKVPGKYYSVARCFRPDQVDRTHLTEFNQVEGIVVGAGLSLRDLLGVLERFAVEIAGAEKVRFRPDYFPFTEPSVELQAYKKGYGWLEFGGSGIFRPEVTRPLGVNVPVLAWGIGADRLYMMRAGVEDIRLLFAQDLDWMRKQKAL